MICWAIPTWAAPKPPPGGRTAPPRPKMACKDPGNPMGRASINNGRPLTVGFENGKFGQWQGSQFTPATASGFGGVSTYIVKQDVKLAINARDCVRSVAVYVSGEGQTKRVNPNVAGRRVFTEFKAVDMIDATTAKYSCKAGSKVRPGGPGYNPPVISYPIPKSLHSKSIMNFGGPYLHEQYIDLSIQLQCWKE